MKLAYWLLGGIGLLDLVCIQPANVWAVTSQTSHSHPTTQMRLAALETVPAPAHQPPTLPTLIADTGCPADPLTPTHAADPLTCFNAEDSDTTMGQVRAIDEFQDIQPSDWAYQALKSLVEKYGVLVGTPDRLFHGNRALSRYEFVAAMNAVMARIEQMFVAGELAQLREDFNTIKRLQESDQKNLATVGDRIRELETLTATLERQQFSTTTKLSGQTVFGFTDGTNANATFLTRVRLDLNTSFTGNDLLRTQLEAGNNGRDAINQWQTTRGPNILGTNGILADGGGLDFVEVPSTVRLSKLYYTFTPTKNVSLTVGARLNPRDFIDYNRFANDSLENFSSSFFMNNPLIIQNQVDRPGGAGAAVSWKLGEDSPFTLRALYVAADAENPNGGERGGLFGDRNQGSVELEYSMSKTLVARLQYTSATVNQTAVNAGGFNLEWAPNRQFAVFGRLGIGRYNGFNTLLKQDLDLNPVSWAFGGTIRDIVIPGSIVGLAIGQPFIEGDIGDATQFNAEAYYSFQLNDRVSVSPALIVVANPNNRATGTIFEWLMRMVYQF